MIHRIHEDLLTDPVTVDLAGCGGSGSQMLTGLARMHLALLAVGHPGLRVTAYDPDCVTEANVGRQLFYPNDVGVNKAFALIQRLNLCFGLHWYANPNPYPDDAQDPDLLITCVDTAKARRVIGKELNSAYWLDLGNDTTAGQVILGEPKKQSFHRRPDETVQLKPDQPHRLPTVLEVFPELNNPKFKESNTPSCGLAEALNKQDLFINQAVVTFALNLLWRLFRHGLEYHGGFINLTTGVTRPLPCPGPRAGDSAQH